MHLADEIYLKRILQKTKGAQTWRKHFDKQKMDEKKAIKKRKENIKAKPT
jgi:gamma-glutamyl:cysteine ligase YbdK (ATP-grasp superfamily)